MKKIIILFLSLLPVFVYGQVTQLELEKMVGDSVKNTLADLNVQLSVTVLDSASLNTEAELETLTGINFYKVGDNIPLDDGGLGMTSGDKGSIVYFTAGNALGRKAWAAAGALLGTGADSTFSWITDLPTAMTIGTAYIYRVGGTAVGDADIASAATWNARLDSAIIITFPDTSTSVASYTYVLNNAQQDADTSSWDATKTDLAGLDDYFDLDGAIIYPSTSGDYFEMRKTGLAHGMTSLMTTSAFMYLNIADATDGGLEIRSVVNDVDNEGLLLGVGVNGDTPTTYPIQIQAGKKSGTTWSPFVGDVPLIGFYNNTQQVMAFGSGGSMGIGSECEYKNHQLSLYDTDPSICLTDASINKVVNSVSAAEDTNALILEANDTSPSIEFVNAVGNKHTITIDALGDTAEFTGALEYQFDAPVVASNISAKADSGSVGYLDQAETIAGNWVNESNPWADNEVADNITASSYLPLAGGNMTGDIAFSDPGTSANSKSLIFISDNGGEPDSASIQAIFGDDPYLRFFAPNDAGNLTAIMDLKDQRIVIGAGTAGVDYDLFFNGETNDGIFTYDEDNDVFGFDNGVQANHLLVGDGTALPAGIATFCPIAVKDDSLMISFDNGTTWVHIVTQSRATP